MSTGRRYSVTLRWNEHQQAYLATGDELPGAENSGHTREEALASVQEAIRRWLESATEGTRPQAAEQKPDAQPPP